MIDADGCELSLLKTCFLGMVNMTRQLTTPGIWVIILAVIGYLVGNNQELISSYSHRAFYLLIPFLLCCCIYYVWRHRRKSSSR